MHWGGLKGFLHDWMFSKVIINGTIMISYMGSQWDKIKSLELLQSLKFSHSPRGQ